MTIKKIYTAKRIISIPNRNSKEKKKNSSQSSNIFRSKNTKQKGLNYEVKFIYIDESDKSSYNIKNEYNECNSVYGGNVSDKMSCKQWMTYKIFSEISEEAISWRNYNYNSAKRIEEEQNSDEDSEDVKEEINEKYDEEFLTKNQSIKIDPIDFYTFKTKRAGGLSPNKKTCQLEEFDFYLYLNREKDEEVVKLSKRLERLPCIKSLQFEFVKPGDKNVLIFLLNVAPKKLERFIFGGSSDDKYGFELLRIDYYFNVLDDVLKAKTKEAGFYDCSITSYELQKIFLSASHLEKLLFNN